MLKDMLLVAENILSQIDDHGHMHMMLDEIEDHGVLLDANLKDKGIYTTKQSNMQKSVPLKGGTYF